jgi:hypothetical protein
MAPISRNARLQHFSWPVLEDLVFCGERWPRLAELAAQVLVEQQVATPAVPIDPALEALIPFRGQPPGGAPAGAVAFLLVACARTRHQHSAEHRAGQAADDDPSAAGHDG